MTVRHIYRNKRTNCTVCSKPCFARSVGTPPRNITWLQHIVNICISTFRPFVCFSMVKLSMQNKPVMVNIAQIRGALWDNRAIEGLLGWPPSYRRGSHYLVITCPVINWEKCSFEWLNHPLFCLMFLRSFVKKKSALSNYGSTQTYISLPKYLFIQNEKLQANDM